LVKKIQNKEIVSRTGALIIGLHGDLGAGKTTFMKSFAEALGVKDTVQSPTFVITPLPWEQ
jgi:tRNA threonylcarbamoyladenosine biosynthesis protein TsaE